MNHRNFVNGRLANLLLCFFGLLVIFFYRERVGAHDYIWYLVFSIVFAAVFILMLVLHPGKRLGERGCVRFMCAAISLMALGIGFLYKSYDAVLYVFLIQSFLMVIFVDAIIFRFHLALLALNIIFCAVCYFLGYGFEELRPHHIFGFVCLLAIQWLCVALIRLLEDQNKRILYQEMGMNDMLKLVISKCEEYKKAVKGKSDFLSNMSHEIRTPVNSVLGMNEMILRESKDEHIREYAGNIYKSGQVLLSLINDILDYSRIEAGKMEIIPTMYSMFSFLQDIVALIKEQANEKNLRFQLDIDKHIPGQLYGDDVRLRQVFTNLLTNAVKYTQEGSVTLKIRSEKVSEYKIMLHCEVRDTGIGIKKENIPQLFEAFERVDKKKNRNIIGTGLGISITSQILGLMDSELHVESDYGKGSVFWFDVIQDIVEDDPIGDVLGKFKESGDEYRYHVSLYAPEAKILVVDDNEINRKVFINLLKQTGIQISQVDSGRKCLELVKRERFDIIFLDHMMPGMDGVETLHGIRERENLCRDVPVVVLTANAIAGARNRYIQEGFDDYLAKPISPGKLEKMVRDILPVELLDEPAGVVAKEIQQRETAEVVEIQLPEIPGFFWDAAMPHFTDEEMLLSSVEDFYKLIPSMADKLENLFTNIREEGALENYQITVHGMKSAAALIGAMDLSGCARTLETAAMRSLLDVIDVLTPIFLEDWRNSEELLRPMFEGKTETSEKKEDDQIVLALLEMLRNAAEVMNLDDMDNSIEELAQYKLPEGCEEIFKDLLAAVTDLDTQAIDELAKRIMESVRARLRSGVR